MKPFANTSKPIVPTLPALANQTVHYCSMRSGEVGIPQGDVQPGMNGYSATQVLLLPNGEEKSYPVNDLTLTTRNHAIRKGFKV